MKNLVKSVYVILLLLVGYGLYVYTNGPDSNDEQDRQLSDATSYEAGSTFDLGQPPEMSILDNDSFGDDLGGYDLEDIPGYTRPTTTGQASATPADTADEPSIPWSQPLTTGPTSEPATAFSQPAEATAAPPVSSPFETVETPVANPPFNDPAAATVGPIDTPVDTTFNATPDNSFPTNNVGMNAATSQPVGGMADNVPAPSVATESPQVGSSATTPDLEARAVATGDLPPLPADMMQVPEHPVLLVGRSPQDPAILANPETLRPEFRAFMDDVVARLKRGEELPMYYVLSAWYGDPRLTQAERDVVTKVLNQVASQVIYSNRHMLSGPYTVRHGETLSDIAAQYKITPELLAKINGIADPASAVMPGTQLKVLPGPFEAVIDLSDTVLVLRLGGRYAGQFDIGVGYELTRRNFGVPAVNCKVVSRERGPAIETPDRYFAGDDPKNPLGGYKIDLGGDDLCIHGTPYPDEDIGATDAPGFISMRPQEAGHVFDILADNAFIVIQQ